MSSSSVSTPPPLEAVFRRIKQLVATMSDAATPPILAAYCDVVCAQYACAKGML